MGAETTRLTFAGRWGLTPRSIRRALGVLWIIDALLQYEPRMFTSQLVTMMFEPMAAGQIAPVAWGIHTTSHIILPDVAVWNFLFATVQLAIGVGLLFARTTKPALVTMFVWSFGVWWIGEGFSMMLTGHGSPFTGAPGAVIVYSLIGVLVWPRESGGEPRTAGFASAAGADGPFGTRASLGIWAGLWSLFAVLSLTPANRTRTWIHDALLTATSGQPGWYAHFLKSVARAFSSGDASWAYVLAVAFLTIGIGPLVVRESSRVIPAFFVAGALTELLFWVTGQALGGVLTGMGTDPQTGPLMVLLSVTVVPVALAARPVTEHAAGLEEVPGGRLASALPSVQPPVSIVRRLVSWSPVSIGAAGAGLAAAMLLASTYPEAAAAVAGNSSPSTANSPAAAAAGMSGMAGMTGKNSGKNVSSTMTSNPLLAPEAMGGTDPGWHYYGPALNAAFTGLLTGVSAITDAGHKMQTPACTATPTAAQLEAAVRIVQDTSAGVSSYLSLSAAAAAGYIPVTTTIYPIVHYVNLAYMNDTDVLNPQKVDSLVYAVTPYGPVLAAAMYLMPSVSEPGPMPAGCLLQWHAHTNLCSDEVTHTIVGFTPCGAGEYNSPTPVMAHVWQVPVPGGPLALDPSDLDVVEAAVMAQQCGEAPFNPSTPPPPAAPGECAAYYGTGSSASSGGSSPSSASASSGSPAPVPSGDVALAP